MMVVLWPPAPPRPRIIRGAPITIVVPAAAGGPTDTISRVTAQAMSKLLGQQILIENVGGAGGTIGTGRVVRAAPDGYTLLIFHVGLATAATLYRQLPYDTKQAFAPVGLITDAPMTIIARSDFAPNTLGELIPHLKSREKTTIGNAGVGSAAHLCGMLFMSETKLQLTTVPYRGTAPVMNDLIGKQIDMACEHYRSDSRKADQGLRSYHQGKAENAARHSDRRRGRSQGL
jgi:putative tricarboxylic transport membrane protein